MSDTPVGTSEETILSKLLKDENEKILKGMLSMPTHMNRQMVESRREEIFSFFWEHMGMEKSVALNLIKEKENKLMKLHAESAENIPNWLHRMESQDVLMQHFAKELDEELNLGLY